MLLLLLIWALLPGQVFDGSRPTVMVFVRTDCPISNRYAPELKRLYREYSAHVRFYLVYPDAAESDDAVRKHRAEYGYSAPFLRDPGHALVKRAKATVTPEAAVFSADGRLLYHGRIDNRYVDLGRAMPAPTRHDLEDALAAIRAGRPVPVESAPAVGCSLADAR